MVRLHSFILILFILGCEITEESKKDSSPKEQKEKGNKGGRGEGRKDEKVSFKTLGNDENGDIGLKIKDYLHDINIKNLNKRYTKLEELVSEATSKKDYIFEQVFEITETLIDKIPQNSKNIANYIKILEKLIDFITKNKSTELEKVKKLKEKIDNNKSKFKNVQDFNETVNNIENIIKKQDKEDPSPEKPKVNESVFSTETKESVNVSNVNSSKISNKKDSEGSLKEMHEENKQTGVHKVNPFQIEEKENNNELQKNDSEVLNILNNAKQSISGITGKFLERSRESAENNLKKISEGKFFAEEYSKIHTEIVFKLLNLLPNSNPKYKIDYIVDYIKKIKNHYPKFREWIPEKMETSINGLFKNKFKPATDKTKNITSYHTIGDLIKG